MARHYQASDKRKVIVIGTSVGGAMAVKKIIAELPRDFAAAILIVQHIGPYRSNLAEQLAGLTRLPVRDAIHGETIHAGTVLLAPSDHHLIVAGESVNLIRGPKENFARPAVDPLFRSAAIHYQNNVIGVVLTGHLDDGTVGLQAIKSYGGTTIVQDPQDAEAPGMPRNALQFVDVDFCLPLDKIAKLLIRLVNDQDGKARCVSNSPIPISIKAEHDFILKEASHMEYLEKIGKPSSLTCPDCHGSLWQLDTEPPERFRCHTGHAFTAQSLMIAQERDVEDTIWKAVRALHEKQVLLRRLAVSEIRNQRFDAAAEHDAAAAHARDSAETLKRIVEGHKILHMPRSS